MAKKRKRSAFPQYDKPSMPAAKESYVADEAIGGVFGFFRDFGTRETIESIIVAVILALMFRAYEAEAFIIPTGSMAPSLQGQHKDLECESCGYRYRAGASTETSLDRFGHPVRVNATYCPICQYETKIRGNVSDHNTNNGDRILVNKFVYDFAEPERYDVIVFKNPNNGKQNYIKRLIGLPGDNILIENGDIFLLSKNETGGWDRRISRKPPQKLRHILQTVDDTDFIGDALKEIHWPDRWQEFKGGEQWERVESDEHPNFISEKSGQISWLRYRHFRPFKSEWGTISSGELPDRFRQSELPKGRLIGDQYAYNDETDSNPESIPADFRDLGLHWVGDIGLECWAKIESSDGTLLLDLVEGGAHFTCEIDVATGRATLKCDDSSVSFETPSGEKTSSPAGTTNLVGTGNYHLRYVNADDRINLWVNNQLVKFDAADYVREGIAIPTYRDDDPGDAEPAGIAAKNLAVRLTRLKIVRDIYYTSVRGDTRWMDRSIRNLDNETENANIGELIELQQRPELWSNPEVIKLFQQKKNQQEPMFKLKIGDTRDKDQFLPMGDNSPQSLDGRVWAGPKYVERDMLIGRALFIYWPHSLNEPIKFFPNFGRMGFIR